MSREYMYMMEDVLENVVSTSGVSSLVSVAAYVFTALALYTIAQRREIKKAWLAWVPVLNVWILGSISDQYRYVVKGEVRNKRKVLLTISILHFLASAVAVIKLVIASFMVVYNYAPGVGLTEMLHQLLSSLVFFIPVAILGVVSLIFRIISLYDVYTSCDPANNVLYLVLSLIPGVNSITQPLFLFLCRNQDGGMPPRREAAEYTNL